MKHKYIYKYTIKILNFFLAKHDGIKKDISKETLHTQNGYY